CASGHHLHSPSSPTRRSSDLRRAELEGQIADAQASVLEKGEVGSAERLAAFESAGTGVALSGPGIVLEIEDSAPLPASPGVSSRSEEHTSELQSRFDLVCRLL